MNSKNKYFVSLVVLSAIFVAVVFVGFKAEASKSDTTERVIAHTKAEVSSAIASGCKVVREAKTLKALSCPEGVGASLGLLEDVKVFALGNNDISLDVSRRPGGGGSGGTSYTSPLNQIGADIVQSAGNTGTGRKIAILDTGYNYTHPELVSSYLGGYDFVNNDNDPMDDDGHGSHVAGIITADGVDSRAKGVAPDATILSGKVLDQNGSGSFSDVVAAIYWVVDGPDGIYGTSDDFGVDVINLSLGTSAPYLYKGFCDNALPDLTTAIKYAIDRNVVVAVAAGNSGGSGVSLPGCISYSTTVGAVDNQDKIASFSGKGNAVDITAPGVSIFSSILGSSYASWSGTSMATPMISGVVALIKSAHPTFTQSAVENKLFTTAKDLGKSGKDTSFGWGRVRANMAVQ